MVVAVGGPLFRRVDCARRDLDDSCNGMKCTARPKVRLGLSGAALSSTADNSFDFVMSCVGAMFALHKATADELVRVARPGGTIGMINWGARGGLSAGGSTR
jgi:threonine dehydrogenase-like Zn-dependent dehydrogenase